MQMINEITVIQQNKNLFNKIIAGLNKEKKKLKLDYRQNYSKTIDDKKVGFSFQNSPKMWFITNIEGVPENIILVQEKELIYFCTTLAKRVKLFVSYRSTYDTGDYALDIICYYRDRYYKNYQSIFVENGIYESSSDEYIKNTKLYKDVREAVDKINDMEINFVLRKDVPNLSKLSQRVNILPLIIYNIKEDWFKYPDSPAINSRSKTMVKKYTSEVVTDGVKEMCSSAFWYASVRYWCGLDVRLPGSNFSFY